jgi:hypothetical protein
LSSEHGRTPELLPAAEEACPKRHVLHSSIKGKAPVFIGSSIASAWALAWRDPYRDSRLPKRRFPKLGMPGLTDKHSIGPSFPVSEPHTTWIGSRDYCNYKCKCLLVGCKSASCLQQMLVAGRPWNTCFAMNNSWFTQNRRVTRRHGLLPESRHRGSDLGCPSTAQPRNHCQAPKPPISLIPIAKLNARELAGESVCAL